MWLFGCMSTGAKTQEAIERIRRAVTKHGRYSKRSREEMEYYRELLRRTRKMLAAI
jgi:hypothetical protein